MCNMLEGGFTPMASLEELRDMGFHIVLHPLTGAGFIGVIRVARLGPTAGRVLAGRSGASCGCCCARTALRGALQSMWWQQKRWSKSLSAVACLLLKRPSCCILHLHSVPRALQRAVPHLRSTQHTVPLSATAGLYAATRALLDSYGSLSANGTTTREAMEHMVSWRVSPSQVRAIST